MQGYLYYDLIVHVTLVLLIQIQMFSSLKTFLSTIRLLPLVGHTLPSPCPPPQKKKKRNEEKRKRMCQSLIYQDGQVKYSSQIWKKGFLKKRNKFFKKNPSIKEAKKVDFDLKGIKQLSNIIKHQYKHA